MCMWQRYFKKKIYFVLPKDATIVNRPGISASCRKEMLECTQVDPAEAEKALATINPEWFVNGAAIDLKRLVDLLADDHSARYNESAHRQMVMMSRVKLQGTDGMRGKIRVVDFSYSQAVTIFLQDGAITPALFELAAHSLASLLLENGAITEEDTCTFGEDSRDILTGGVFAEAVIRGFNRMGIDVYNAGVLATPGVIIYAAYAQSRIAAILTASHNPANQNGLKFVFDGFKLLEESDVGEYALTAMMFKLANSKQPRAGKLEFEDVHEEAEKVLIQANIANSWLQPGELQNVKLVYDGANGAYSRTAPQVFDRLKIAHIAINTKPLGHNINKDGGVAELEGTKCFDSVSDQNEKLSAVEKIFEIGRQNPRQLVCGLVNDADGDRGYMLVYDSQNDRVWVLSGDELAIWIAEGMRERREIDSESVFVASVESDLLVSAHARLKLGLRTEVACVGDKWLLVPARQGKKFTVGVEESGHVTFACEIDNREGRRVRVFTGNGMLSVLRVLAVINKLNPDISQMIHPFEPGFKDFRSVYFVDKSRFYPRSRIWQDDCALIQSTLSATLPKTFSCQQIRFENDPSMLYFAVVNRGGESVAAVFVRNSGTENKTVVTIRGERRFEELLTRVMLEIHSYHISVMKDMNSPEAMRELAIKKLLTENPASPETLKSRLEQQINSSIPQVDFDALIYAMRKQKLIAFENNLLHSLIL